MVDKTNYMYQAFKKAGIDVDPPKVKPVRHKKFSCFKCGKTMTFIDNTNIMACDCGQYFIFDSDLAKYY